LKNKILIACRHKGANEKLFNTIHGINARYSVAVVTDEETMYERISELQPDILFLDAHFALCATAMLAAQLRKKHKQMKLAVFERKPRPTKYAARFVLWGVENYLSAQNGSRYYEKEITKILNGDDLIPDYILKELDRYVSVPECSLNFTKTDCRVLEQLRNGLSNDEIAEHCHLGSHTIRNVVSALYTKTNTNNTIMLLNVAANRGAIIGEWIPEYSDDDKYDLPDHDVITKANISLVKIGVAQIANQIKNKRLLNDN
jgi:DNA-binding NarL/FixJ family response regulator